MDEVLNLAAVRERLRAQFSAALGSDPVCNGRVTSATVDWLADEAIRACLAVGRAARTSVSPPPAKGHGEPPSPTAPER